MASERAHKVSYIALSLISGVLDAVIVILLIGEILIAINGKTPPLIPAHALGIGLLIVCRRGYKTIAELSHIQLRAAPKKERQ